VASLERFPLPGEFDLEKTLHCGQVFHWRRAGAGFVGVIGTRGLYVEQQEDALWVSPGSADLFRHYLALDHPLEEIYASLPRDAAMQAALTACRGLRIIRQPLWECLGTFITSALKQVAHIAQISENLRRRFGAPLGEVGGHAVFAYPAVERIASASEAELRACGLGFRAVSLLATARVLVETPPGGECVLESWRALDRAGALAALTALRGVGTKVANCVLLFGYEHLDAFPIDVWIEKVLRTSYFANEPGTPLARLQEFADEHFGRFGGYAQQYLFHHARTVGRATLRLPPSAEGAAPAKPIRRVRAAKKHKGRRS
jgi:N-glycosylase/DNA lyase